MKKLNYMMLDSSNARHFVFSVGRKRAVEKRKEILDHLMKNYPFSKESRYEYFQKNNRVTALVLEKSILSEKKKKIVSPVFMISGLIKNGMACYENEKEIVEVSTQRGVVQSITVHKKNEPGKEYEKIILLKYTKKGIVKKNLTVSKFIRSKGIVFSSTRSIVNKLLIGFFFMLLAVLSTFNLLYSAGIACEKNKTEEYKREVIITEKKISDAMQKEKNESFFSVPYLLNLFSSERIIIKEINIIQGKNFLIDGNGNSTEYLEYLKNLNEIKEVTLDYSKSKDGVDSEFRIKGVLK